MIKVADEAIEKADSQIKEDHYLPQSQNPETDIPQFPLYLYTLLPYNYKQQKDEPPCIKKNLENLSGKKKVYIFAGTKLRI